MDVGVDVDTGADVDVGCRKAYTFVFLRVTLMLDIKYRESRYLLTR